MKHTGCDKYILDDKKKRKAKPDKKDKKRYKVYKEDVHWINVALTTCLVGHEAFILIKDFSNGIKAWDALMNRYDRRVFNKGTARTGDLSELLDIKSESIKKGSYRHSLEWMRNQ